MSRKQEAPERPLPDRIAKARQEGRSQHALDLARQLFKHNQTEEHRELLRQVTFERGKHLQAEGKTGDAATVYENLLAMGGAPELLAEVAVRLAACGAGARALAVMPQDADPIQRQRLLQQSADAAIAMGAAGKNSLPPELHAGFDLTLQAFRHYEAGRDEDARAALQGIGLQSPFLEWKVLLRGLLAYYAKDDARAVENWQRLDPNRLPHRVCASLRAGIDPGYLNAQPIATQRSVKERIARQQAGTLAGPLRDLGIEIQQDNMAPAFRKAEALIRSQARDHPDLAPRLAHLFFWAVIDHGQPEDIERYLRVFGRAGDDPESYRLEALALEARGLWPEAHKCWQLFIEHVARSPAEWPGEIGTRVQAMIWSRMAENALPSRRRRGRSGNPFFDMFADQTAPLKPTAEQCYEKAIKLAPDRIAAYIPLFQLHRANNKLAKAKKLGQQMLKRFPDRADTLEALGELSLQTKDYKKAQEYFEKSIQANPLDRDLRGKLARARQRLGLELTLTRKYDLARVQYEKALQLWEGPKTPLLCQWAIAELKADKPSKADELIAQSLAEPDHRLACRFALVGESVRANLPAKQKKQFTADLKDALAQSPTPAEILVLLESAAAQRRTHDESFSGQKTQERTIVKFLGAIDFDNFSEEQLQRIVTGLQVLDARRPWLNCVRNAEDRHPENPFFQLSQADYYLTSPRGPVVEEAEWHLKRARELVQKMPRGELQESILDAIKQKERHIAELKARNPSILDMIDHMFGDDEDDDDADTW